MSNNGRLNLDLWHSAAVSTLRRSEVPNDRAYARALDLSHQAWLEGTMAATMQASECAAERSERRLEANVN